MQPMKFDESSNNNGDIGVKEFYNVGYALNDDICLVFSKGCICSKYIEFTDYIIFWNL